jgi:uncharacterized protein
VRRRYVITSVITRALYRLGASLFLVLGMIGMIVPVMPTTIFLLLSAWCLLKLGDRRADLLLRHPRLGLPLRLFLEQGAMKRRSKLVALGGLSLAAAGLFAIAQPWLAGGSIGCLALVAIYLVTRPESRPQTVRI